jgi:tRNA-2-methylthio-N6-dimethylallyladenosine synthase
MTSHPKDLSDELIEVMAGAKHVLPQFHLPVQSGDDEILRRMNRHYNRAHYMERVRRLREAVPGIGLTTDLIVAFPGETEEQFEHTLSLVDEVGYDSAFTFIYSPRTGTAAAAMPDQIDPEVASERIQRLIALQEKRQREEMLRFVGTREEVLVEGLSRRNANEVSGRGRHGITVSLAGSEEDIGRIVPVEITGVKLNTLAGSRIGDVI